MRKVAIVFNGGTISMKVDERLKAAVPTLTSSEVLSMVTGIERFAKIESFTFSNLPSPQMSPKVMMELSLYVKKLLLRDDIDGVVVTHGTDSLEETAFLLDLTIKSSKPVVITGSMRSASELGYDGPANLSAAICTAISKGARNRGVLVCLNDEINCAHEVTKANSMSLNAFRSPSFGPIGIVDNNQVIFYRDSVKKQQILTESIDDKVYLFKCVSGMDSALINYSLGLGATGIVIEGMGRGNVPPDVVSGIKNAIDKNLPVVLVSRCYEGRVLDTYGYHGGGSELRKLGVIFADNLPGQKARIKLMLALSITKDVNKIKEIFEDGIYK
jgi:L-asparaginase